MQHICGSHRRPMTTFILAIEFTRAVRAAHQNDWRCDGAPETLPTFFTGCSCILLQSETLQVEGVAVVPERHPRPLSQRVGALAGVAPLVYHRLVWRGEKQQKLKHFIHIRVFCDVYLCNVLNDI